MPLGLHSIDRRIPVFGSSYFWISHRIRCWPAKGDYFHTGAGARYLEQAKGEVVTVPLRGNINVLMGSGGNITVLSGSEGKFLVDAGIKPSKDKLQAALNKIGPSPLKYVVNTHWHWDHTDGNEWLHAAGATIIAQRNTVKHLSEATPVNDWNWTFAPVPAGARPTIVVDNKMEFTFAGESIKVEHFGPGHTDGDVLVYFEKADVYGLRRYVLEWILSVHRQRRRWQRQFRHHLGQHGHRTHHGENDPDSWPWAGRQPRPID